MRAAFAVPSRVLASAPAVRRAVLALVFTAGIVLFGWVLSGQAQASESTADGVVPTAPVVDGTSVATVVDTVAAPVVDPVVDAVTQPAPAVIPVPEGVEAYEPDTSLALPVAENTDRMPVDMFDEAARVADDLREKGETAFRPIVDRVGRDLPPGFPVKPGAGHIPSTSTGGPGAGAAVVPSAPAATAAEATVSPASPTRPAVTTQTSTPDVEQPGAVRAFADQGMAALRSGLGGGTSHPPAPLHHSTSSDDAVAGSAQRGGAPGGVFVSAAPVVPVHLVPTTAVGEPDAELIDRTEEVPVSPA